MLVESSDRLATALEASVRSTEHGTAPSPNWPRCRNDDRADVLGTPSDGRRTIRVMEIFGVGDVDEEERR